MKKNKCAFLAFALLLLTFNFSSCSGGSSYTAPTGPDLDVDELASLKIDQIKFTLPADKADLKSIDAAIYVHCKDDNSYLACAGKRQGLSIIEMSGLVYGGIDVPLTKVEGAEGSCLDVEIVFVEKNSDNCPATVDPDDTIVATSSPVKLDEDGKGTLLDSRIESTDGTNWIKFIAQDKEPSTDLTPSPALTDAILTLDHIYFTRPDIANKDADFVLVVRGKGSDTGFRCSVTFDTAAGPVKQGMMYGNLNIQLKDNSDAPCAITDANKYSKVDVLLTILTDDGDTKETLTTNADTESTLADLIDGDGMRERFIDDGGFVRFYHIEGF